MAEMQLIKDTVDSSRKRGTPRLEVEDTCLKIEISKMFLSSGLY